MRLAKWVFLPAFLNAQAPPADAVSVRSVAIEAPTPGGAYSLVTVGLENRSKKSITAFRVSLTSTFEDGSVRKQQDGFVDLLPLYILGQQDFRPGETYDYRVSLYGAPTKVEVLVSAVALDDHTVLGSPEDASALLDQRAHNERLLKSVVEALKMMIVQSPDPDVLGRSRERWFSYSDPPNERDRMLYAVLQSTKGKKASIEKVIRDSEACIEAMKRQYVTWGVEHQ
ncbi:MAG TPA: hypothetical protein VMT15_01760 [Bryobacteraceae bacterium]|nr:hypothetical protein [Bryobacteraceae bacterium]